MSAGGGQSAPEPVPSGIEERPSAGLVIRGALMIYNGLQVRRAASAA